MPRIPATMNDRHQFVGCPFLNSISLRWVAKADMPHSKWQTRWRTADTGQSECGINALCTCHVGFEPNERTEEGRNAVAQLQQKHCVKRLLFTKNSTWKFYIYVLFYVFIFYHPQSGIRVVDLPNTNTSSRWCCCCCFNVSNLVQV